MDGNPVAANFGKNLRFHRKRAMLSQEDLGSRASVHRTEVGLLERGERIPRIDTLIKIAGALEIPPTALIEGIEWEQGIVSLGRFEVASSSEETL